MAPDARNPRVEALIRRLDEAWRASRWHSLQGALEGMTDDEAEWVPPDYQSPDPWGFSGCILDIVFHVAVDNFVYPEQAVGKRSQTAEIIEARFSDKGGDRQAALDLLHDSHEHVRTVLSTLDDADLERRVEAEGIYQGRRVETLFVELIEHDIYHAGQINYIRSLYDGATAGEDTTD